MVWLACGNSADVGIQERAHAAGERDSDSFVELELIVEPMIPEIETAIEGELVVAMS